MGDFKITRRGFRNAPPAVKEIANDLVVLFAEEQNVLAQLRPGDGGAYMLDLMGVETGHELIVIERPEA